ncbi:MAG: bifunctional methylenetetrahydrofolate dehydrogenase/methenyltetrahydrofolate cyclohydrolase FolD [Candidatus Caldatribacterium sp.]|uniref:bifunctional methylenetetrahydrofolate dehydrogenase/methenyltetrahydrofolate cyclohydrolase FolD n=1 Tax=Candidatus Caldatribacterium sp. TaxID=2282143 RepID=UPI002995366C|nr:bifunctional methylenetetrahydrofolate dehydrogenase/methenyltetrahydrofolate cyclohydrolase FolD [Candidatus Caldatribacterium sp.]MCX7730378.1 bifunctional methylenetetrahydrofolate dehydrogenase/methenyltetrahydrofolate cyclohydrolase FolD [Candidatus Caldatribacterium sp.]MDW8080658.1 bifunctional methylenetetrahydrofolate dehydrogenase/methenyltetrahydrofolate cyclohydrolase FolD [Candidatus Calescibacterium sp.]
MSFQILDGKAAAAKIYEELQPRVSRLTSLGYRPGLAVILVGNNPASQVYVRNKERACEKLGIRSFLHHLPEETDTVKLLELIDSLNADPAVHGILVQLPLPPHLEEREVLYRISPEKDVDGFHPYNLGRLMIGDPLFLPCTPWGVQELLVRYGIAVEGKHVVIVGRSTIVGKPLAMMLVQKAKGANATVTVCHTKTANLPEHTKRADILVAACGSPGLITGDMVREGVVVVDVGINRVGERLVGDVDFASVAPKASYITPVPGGVGPMTVAMLMANTVKAAERFFQAEGEKRYGCCHSL